MTVLGRKAIALICAAAQSATCAVAMGKPLYGRVVNHVDGSPIAGAFVTARWYYHGSDPFGSRSSCTHVEIVRTDVDGRYVIPGQSSGPADVIVYASSYQRFTMNGLQYNLQEMVPFAGTLRERQQQLQIFGSLARCHNDDIVGTLRPLYEALDDEYRSLGLPANTILNLDNLARLLREERLKGARQ